MRYHDGVRITLRQYLMAKQIEAGCDLFTAIEAVVSLERAHPGWTMDRLLTYAKWETLAVKEPEVVR